MSVFTGSRHRFSQALQALHKTGEVIATLSLTRTTDKDRESYDTISTRAGDTMESLARRLYGDGIKWYLIADANPEIFWPMDLEPGTKIRIPPVGTASLR